MSDSHTNEDDLRPSRIREISEGRLYWGEVDVLNIDDDATALRSGLETFGLKVNLYNCVLATHVQQVLGKNGSNAKYIIVNAHGDDDGAILLPEVAEHVAANQPFKDRMMPDDLARFVDVEDKLIICTACGGGHKKLAEVFLRDGKANAFVGDTLAPFGYVSYLFPILLFYFMTQYPDITIEDAFARAKKSDPQEFDTWILLKR